MKIFEVVGQNFFVPLASKHKQIYVDCLEIIIDECNLEMSFNADKESIVERLIPYFEINSYEDIRFEDDEEVLRDSKTKAYTVLRNLERYGWIEVSADYKQTTVSVLEQAVSIFKTLKSIENQEETEYRTEISQIYGLLTNEEFYQHPYSDILESVVKRTDDLVTGLKKLNTSIKKYVNQMTEKITINDVIENLSIYIKSDVSEAYHRLKTSENVYKFRTTIIENLKKIQTDENIYSRAVVECMEQKKVDETVAKEHVQKIILHILNVFNSYDDYITEIDKKNTRYIQSAVDRIKFLNMNADDVETKISVILQTMQYESEEADKEDYSDPILDKYSVIFNLYPQGFINEDSLYTVPIEKTDMKIEKIATMPFLTDEEKEMRALAARAIVDNDFDVKKINSFIIDKIGEKESIKVSEIEIENTKDFMKILYSLFFVKDKKAKYQIQFLNNYILKCGWRIKDFMLRKRGV